MLSPSQIEVLITTSLLGLTVKIVVTIESQPFIPKIYLFLGTYVSGDYKRLDLTS